MGKCLKKSIVFYANVKTNLEIKLTRNVFKEKNGRK